MSTASGAAWRGALLGPNEVMVSPSIVSEAEQAALLTWIEAQYQGGALLDTPPDAGAYSTPFYSSAGGRTRLTDRAAVQSPGAAQELIWVPNLDVSDQPLPEAFWDVRQRVLERLEIPELEEDHYKGAFISYIAPGTGVHAHRDARLNIGRESLMILRCNVMVGRPAEGGMPVIGQTLIEVPERGMWAFFPTEIVHSATPVAGSRFRAILSYGFLLRPDDFWDRLFRLAPRFVADYGLGGGVEAKGALLAQLRSATETQGSAKQRVDLLAFMLDQPGDFSVRKAAGALTMTPAEITAALCDLQRSGLAESASSRKRDRSKVIAL